MANSPGPEDDSRPQNSFLGALAKETKFITPRMRRATSQAHAMTRVRTVAVENRKGIKQRQSV